MASQHIDEAVSRIFGIREDAAFWDGWRAHDDRWAADYLARQVARGVDMATGPTYRLDLLLALRAEARGR